jgi:hypothetical protein
LAVIVGILIGGIATRFLKDGNLLVTTVITGITTIATLMVWTVVKRLTRALR